MRGYGEHDGAYPQHQKHKSRDECTSRKENGYDTDYEVDFGYNLFPEKKYKGVVYKEGYYESVVVTLGKGEGNNWWCVLFPPLCLMETDESNLEEIEYKSFIKENNSNT